MTEIRFGAPGRKTLTGAEIAIRAFQVFSLTQIRKLTIEGCKFQSHIDGSKHIFTPENNVTTQRIIGADIIMALDEC